MSSKNAAGGWPQMGSDDVRSFPFERPSCPVALPALYSRLRAEWPVCRVRLPTGDLAWLVTRWQDARFVLTDKRFSKAALLEPGAPKARPGTLPAGLLMTSDPPEHSVLRAIVGRALNSERVAGLRPAITRIADRLIDGFVAVRGPADFVGGFAEAFAMQATCEVLGIPLADESRFRSWAETVLAVDGRPASEVERAQTELFAYMACVVERKTVCPGDDLCSAMLVGPPAVAAETVLKLVATLLVTGYETMVSALSNSVLALVLAPAGLGLAAGLEEKPEVLDELLRYGTFGDAVRSRRAVEDVRIRDVLVRRGDLVVVSIASANRDEAEFTGADRFDPDRSPNRHLSFGRGIHHCVGSQLARAELEIVLDRLAVRLPSLRLAVCPGEITMRVNSAEGVPERLPVKW